MTTIYIQLFGYVCLKTGTGGRDSRDPTDNGGMREGKARNYGDYRVNVRLPRLKGKWTLNRYEIRDPKVTTPNKIIWCVVVCSVRFTTHT